MDETTKKIAICYFGMTRSTKYIYQSHKENLYQILQKNNIEYDTYMHTWETSCNMIWNNPIDIPIDYDEYKLLDIDYYTIENQNDYLQKIDFNDYCNIELYEMYGDSEHEWIPQLIKNHLCALESQKRVYNMVRNSKKEYDYILFIRPDVLITNEFDIKWLSYFQEDNTDILILDYDHYDGLNDKFSILPYHSALEYATRIDEIIEFRKNHGRIVSEKYVKYIIDKYYPKIKFINFIMKIIRPDGIL
jgi:hypothetical protein